jgi:hypothetical protein
MRSKRRCAPLGEVAHSRERPSSLGEVAPSYLSLCTLVIFWGYGRGGSPYTTTWLPPSHTWCAPSPLGAPSSLTLFTSCYIIKHSPIAKASWSLGRIACVSLYCIIFVNWNKRLWRLHACVKFHVWNIYVKCLIVR